MRVQEKVVLVTGAAQGIGAAIAAGFIQEGHLVYVSDIQVEGGTAISRQLGERSRFIELDVRVETQWQQAIEAILNKEGRLDVLVNNAGVTGYHEALGPQNPEEASLESWRIVHETNLNGTFLGCKYGIMAMKHNQTHSAIINISSRSGQVGIPHAAAYASSKAAIRNHTKSVALYCAEKNIPLTCNSLHPAAVRSPMWDQLLATEQDPEAAYQRLAADIPLKRFGLPSEVAAAAVFLASDAARYITGIELNIDGGLLAGTAASPKSSE